MPADIATVASRARILEDPVLGSARPIASTRDRGSLDAVDAERRHVRSEPADFVEPRAAHGVLLGPGQAPESVHHEVEALVRAGQIAEPHARLRTAGTDRVRDPRGLVSGSK